MKSLAGGLLVVMAAGLAVAPIPPSWVERWYALAAYPPVQRVVTTAANRLTFAAFDVLVAVVVLLGLWLLVRIAANLLRWRPLRVARALGSLVAAAAGLYLWFLLLWGLHYRNAPIETRLRSHAPRADAAAVAALGTVAVRAANALGGAEGAARLPKADDAALRRSLADTLRLVGRPVAIEPGRLKQTALGPFFRWAGVDGMISPFTLEVLANPDLLPFERPFVTAHEWGHLAGFADEAEASFVGWVTCVRADPAARYSAWLFLLWQVRAEVGADTRRTLDAALAPGPRRDLAAMADRIRRGAAPVIRDASWAAYDHYLKANRVPDGVRSYSRVVTLLATTAFDDDWRPLRRDPLPDTSDLDDPARRRAP